MKGVKRKYLKKNEKENKPSNQSAELCWSFECLHALAVFWIL